MASWRKCVFDCQCRVFPLFNLPKEETARSKWLDFISASCDLSHRSIKTVFVCPRHFTKECFQNYGHFDAGLTTKLTLKTSAVPTVRGDEEAPAASPSPPNLKEEPLDAHFDQSQSKPLPPMLPAEVARLPPSLRTFPIMMIPGVSGKETKTIGTQLSGITMKNHVRSKAVQVTPQTKRPTADAGVQTSDSSECPVRPRKRRRMEMEEEEEDDVAVFNSSRRGSDELRFNEPADTDATPDYEDTKYIVFEKNLRQLFDCCPACGCDCAVQRRRRGTFVSFQQNCGQCGYGRSWQNQPVTGSTPAGDLQLSAAVYFSGGSFRHMRRICSALNLQIHQLDAFRKHSQTFLEPAICHNWKLHQEAVFEQLREQRELPAAGDARARLAGPGARMGSYATLDLESKKILDVQLVQSKEKGNGKLLEKRGLKRSLERLEANGLKVDYMVTDRHSKAHKYLQDRRIPQYYDVWRLEQDLSRRLDALAEKKDFLLVKKWAAAIKHHMYWSAASSTSGDEKVAKWTSLINHIQDVHKHDEPLFPRCAHPQKKTTDPDKWFKPGSKALLEVEKLLLDKRVLRDVPKLCSHHQASSLHAFHNLSLQFAPDAGTFSFMETKCRLFLAALHFNENAAREHQTCANAFLFPESERAGPTVKTRTTYGYVRDLMKLLFTRV
ncbi:uncharacterized protein [Eucyclogobius newberryi]|uniref:uncharacterized protein n=1 Tax=Eucyclogobius newberryi TaxID=166745 RepID=UPI003B59598B